MEIDKGLRKVAEAIGEPIDEDLLLAHQEYCADVEERIHLREADRLVEHLAASTILTLVRGNYEPTVKRSCSALLALVLHRCANDDPMFAEEVQMGLAQILAPDLVPTSKDCKKTLQ